MRCEVVAIGTELLLGQIVDTNSSWIGEQLAIAGIDSLFQTKVGDNLDRMVSTLELALGRSDAVICCGGLGPTQDDITNQSDKLVDEIVTWGTLDKIAERIKEHHDAGANHVCVQVLTHDPLELPMAGWRELSGLLK